MTKREFVKLKRGDVVLAIRHMLDAEGNIIIAENSEWKVDGITLHPAKGQGGKPQKSAELLNLEDGTRYQITRDNSTFFLIYKRKRGPHPGK